MEDEKSVAFRRLLTIMDELRAKCPWDREQTFDSLRNNTIEEVYELADAIASGNRDDIKEELGDMMLHVVFYSKLGSEENVFDITDVLNGVSDKLVYRHPHVFGEINASTALEVSQNWEQLKLNETNKKERRKGVLSGVPRSLPAMVKAYRVSEKAASAGFDWQKKEDVWDKVKEEIAEVEVEIECNSHERLEEEFGDLFFSLINASRLYGIDPELALERCNKRFIGRFNHIEHVAQGEGKEVCNLSFDQMERLWGEAKIIEHSKK